MWDLSGLHARGNGLPRAQCGEHVDTAPPGARQDRGRTFFEEEEMINPTEEDIGRAVIYQAGHPGAPREDGAVTSFNEHSVFVRYRWQHPSAPGQPTLREDLEWLRGEDR